MRKFRVLWLLALSCACACGGSSQNKNSKLPPQEMILNKGSGRKCPQIAGDYVCATKEEKEAGDDPYYARITQSLSSTNQTRYNFITPVFTGTLLADGEIHRLNESDRSVEYVVDCQINSLSWHIAAEGRYNTITTLQLFNQKSATLETVTFENGETKRVRRDCSFDLTTSARR